MTAALTDIQHAILRALADAADLPLARLGRDVELDDLGLDSLDLWTVLIDVEDRTGVAVPAEVFDELASLDGTPTVGGVLDAIAVWPWDQADG